MNHENNPWYQSPPPSAPVSPLLRGARPTSLRAVAAVAVLVLAGVGIWLLARMFPGHLSDRMDWVFMLKMLGMLALASASLFARPLKLNEALGHLLAWGLIAGALLLGFTFKDQLGEGLLRVRSALIPGYAVPLTPGEAVLNQSADGAYYAVGQVNGTPVTFLVDTGASDIVLSPTDAKRLGVDESSLSFDDATETANGVGHGARFSARSLEVGSIKLAEVRMSINQAPMSTSLLGMAFFKKLQSFTFEGGRLRLKARKP